MASIWPLFGASNQLLSALALVACAVFLKRTNRRSMMLWVPMVCDVSRHFHRARGHHLQLIIGIANGTYPMVAGMTTLVNGASLLTAWGAGLQLVFAALILALGVIGCSTGIRKLFEKVPAQQAAQN